MAGRTSDSSFSQTFPVVDPAGSGQTAPFLFNDFSVTGDHLIIESVDNSGSQWTMFTEVRFSQNVPEPTSALLAVLSGFSLITNRRR